MLETDVISQCEKLTEAQQDCLRHVAMLMSSKEIARILHISHHTVDQRLKRAQQILGVSTRAEAARLFAAFENSSNFSSGMYGNLVYGSSELPPARYSRNLSASVDEPSPFADSGTNQLQEEQAMFFQDAPSVDKQPAFLSALLETGRENNLSIPVRIAIIASIVVFSILAFSALVSIAEGLSRLS